MPVVRPSEFPTFFRTVVLKRKGLLDKIPNDLFEKVPKIHSRIIKSTWNRDILFSGELASTRMGIGCVTFMSNRKNGQVKDGIILFNQSWRTIGIYTSQISGGKHYLNSISSYSKSIYFTCTLKQFTEYVFANPKEIPRELRILAEQFQLHQKKPLGVQENLRLDLAEKNEQLEKKLKIKIPIKIKTEYIGWINKANDIKDIDKFKAKTFSSFQQTVEKTFEGNKAIIETKKVKKMITPIKGGNVAKKTIKKTTNKATSPFKAAASKAFTIKI